ncbi:hypothetical protein HPP92_017003 [Vanilla planifolia]|uniref:Phosphoadenosine phosphosulphate reductase domain-containing protein n=1 Tax=Vanilla planifolia TaxID=51239 RepID=A0A835QPA8_VANPL|nr:hypothetical protein HPP92_017003 [Vanilla planifolia]
MRESEHLCAPHRPRQKAERALIPLQIGATNVKSSSHGWNPVQHRREIFIFLLELLSNGLRCCAASVVGPTRHLEMFASPARCDWRELATRAAQALQPHRRSESVNPLGAALATVAAIEIPAKEEKAVSAVNYEELAWDLEHASPLDVMDKALEMFWAILRLPSVEKHYDICIEYMFPDALEVQALIRNKGLFPFYEDVHQECCRARKKALKGLKTWFTGQRKDQSPRTRANRPVVQVDPSFEGLSGVAMDVPVSTLHSEGYLSIGFDPCTMPLLSRQHEREGRWCWNNTKAKECGLHKGKNIIQNFFSFGTKDNGSISPNGNIGTPDIFNTIVNLTRAGIKNPLKLENRKESFIT